MLGKTFADECSPSPYLPPLAQPPKTPPASAVNQLQGVNTASTLVSGALTIADDALANSPLLPIDTLDESQDDKAASQAKSWAELFRATIAGLNHPQDSSSSSTATNLQETSPLNLPLVPTDLQEALALTITDNDPEIKATSSTLADSFLARLPQAGALITANAAIRPAPLAYLSLTLDSPPSLEQIITNLSRISPEPSSTSTTTQKPDLEAFISYLNYLKELFHDILKNFEHHVSKQFFNPASLKQKSLESGISIKEFKSQTTHELDYWKWSLETIHYYYEKTPLAKHTKAQYWLSFFNQYAETEYISAAENFLKSIYNPTDHTFDIIILRVFLYVSKLLLSNKDNPNSYLAYARYLNMQRFLEHIIGKAILAAHQEKYPFNSVLELIHVAQNENELELSFLADYQYPAGSGKDILKNPLYIILFIHPETRDSLLNPKNIDNKWLSCSTKEVINVYKQLENELTIKLDVLTQTPPSINANIANEIAELQDYFHLIGKDENGMLNQQIRLYKLLYSIIHKLYKNLKGIEDPNHEALYKLLLLTILASLLTFTKKRVICRRVPAELEKEILEQPSEHLTFILKDALKLITREPFKESAPNEQTLNLTYLQIATLKISLEVLKEPEFQNNQELLTHRENIEATLQKLQIKNPPSTLSSIPTTSLTATLQPTSVINFLESAPDEQEKYERYILAYFFHPLMITKAANTSLLQTLEKDFLKYSPIWASWKEFLDYRLTTNFINNYIANTKLKLDIFLGIFNNPHLKTTLAQKIAKKFIEEIFQKKLSTNLDAKQILEFLLAIASKICFYHSREEFKQECLQNLQCLGIIIKTEALATASMDLSDLPISLPKILPLIYGPWPTGEKLDHFLDSYICTFTINEQTKKLSAKEALDLNPHFYHFAQIFFNTKSTYDISSSSLLTPNDSGKITTSQLLYPNLRRIDSHYLLAPEKNVVHQYYERLGLKRKKRDPRKHSPLDRESLTFIENILQKEEEVKFLSAEFEQITTNANHLEIRYEIHNTYFNIFYNFLEFIFLQIKEKKDLDKHLELYNQFYKYSAICVINSYVVLNELFESHLKTHTSQTLTEYRQEHTEYVSQNCCLLVDLQVKVLECLRKDSEETFTNNYAKIIDIYNFFRVMGQIISQTELIRVDPKEDAASTAKRILEKSSAEQKNKMLFEIQKIKNESFHLLIAAHKKKLEQQQRENIPESERKKEYESCLQNLQGLINEQRKARLQTEKELQELLAQRKSKAIKAAKASSLNANPEPQKTSAKPATLPKTKKSTKTAIDMHIENMQKDFCITNHVTDLRIAAENLLHMLSTNKMDTAAKIELYLRDANSVISYLIVFIKENLIAKSQSYQSKVRRILNYNPYEQHDFEQHAAEFKSLISYFNNHFKEDAVNTLQALHLSLYLLNEIKSIISNIDSYALKSIKEQQIKNPHLNIDDIIATNKEIQTGCLLRESVIQPLQSLIEEYKQPLNNLQEISKKIISKFIEIKEFKQKLRDTAEYYREKAKQRLQSQRVSLEDTGEESANPAPHKPAKDKVTLRERITQLDTQITQISQATLEIDTLFNLKTFKDELLKINEYTETLAEAISDFADPSKEIASKTLEMYMNLEKALDKN